MKNGMKAIGRLLRQARERRGWPLRRAAGAISVAVPTLSAWECGTKQMPATRLVELADVLVIDLNVLRHRKRS